MIQISPQIQPQALKFALQPLIYMQMNNDADFFMIRPTFKNAFQPQLYANEHIYIYVLKHLNTLYNNLNEVKQVLELIYEISISMKELTNINRQDIIDIS